MVLKILLHKDQSLSLKKVIKKIVGVLYPRECAEMIRDNAYNEDYDLNGDGYLNQQDYDAVYNNFYLKYKPSTIVDLAKVRKAVGTAKSEFDYDNDLEVTMKDVDICHHWVLHGKQPKEKI